jgi:lysophospholipase L1-like esterase
MIPHVLRASLAALTIAALVSSCAGTQGGGANEAATTETSATETSASPEGPLTYVSLGDSLAVGVGASDPREKGYASLYRDLLEEQTGREVRLVQLGISGETTESFIYAPESQLARAEATVRENPGAAVTLSIGANDLLREADGTDAEREAALARYAENLDHILRTLKGASDPAPEITALAIYNPAPGSFTDEWAARLNERIRAVAQRNGARVAAADRAFLGHEAEYSHYDQYSWDIHPTDRGYAALARAFADATIH